MDERIALLQKKIEERKAEKRRFWWPWKAEAPAENPPLVRSLQSSWEQR